MVIGAIVRLSPGSVVQNMISFKSTILLNVLLAVFNMIPIPPLDGSNILIGIVPEAMAVTIEKLRPWGFLLLYALMLSGMLSAIVCPVQGAVLSVLRLLL